MKVWPCIAVVLMLAGCQQLPKVQQLMGKPRPAGTVTLAATALSSAVLRVQIPSRGADAPLSLAGVNGGVETWMAVDTISLSFDRGVLVASRGLGFDLMGANADATLEALAGRAGGVYRREMRYLTGDQHSSYVLAGCTMQEIGAETVAGRRMTRFEERCEARRDSFTNIFWRGADGRIISSRQWLSPEVGYITATLRD